jgi:Mg2+ and Co2+ transporter CorA
VPRIVAFSVPDDVFEELKRRAERKGYALVADYVRSVVLRELGYGEEAEKLREIVREELRRLVGEKGEVHVEAVDVEGLVEKLQKRLERRLQDLVNPWTAKIDSIQARLAELQEKLEAVEAKLKEIEEQAKKEAPATPPPPRYPSAGFQERRGGFEHREHRPRRRSAIDRLREQGVVYEHDVQWLRDRDAFFEKLRREGAIILNLGGERVAVDPEFWRSFKEKIEALPSANDEEIKILLTSQQYDLFRRLKEAGLIYFDATKKAWRFTENPEEE